MKILIIGIKGFIGTNCLQYFSERSHHVYGCDIVPAAGQDYYLLDPANSDFDIVFKKVLPDVCINASGSADVGFSIKHPEVDHRLNVENVGKMLEAIRKYSPECRFLNFSSAAVYGSPRSLPVSESAPLNPLSPYGHNKLKSEMLLREYHNVHGLQTFSMRVFSAYGTGLRKQLFWDIYRKALAGKTIRLFGTGDESRDFIFISDLVAAIDCILRKGSFNGGAINVSSGVETKIGDAARAFLSAIGNDFVLEFTGEEKPGDPKNWKADISLLKQMDFTPFVTFEEGIKKYAAWVKEYE